jgi:hypothetical protein
MSAKAGAACTLNGTEERRNRGGTTRNRWCNDALAVCCFSNATLSAWNRPQRLARQGWL